MPKYSIANCNLRFTVKGSCFDNLLFDENGISEQLFYIVLNDNLGCKVEGIHIYRCKGYYQVRANLCETELELPIGYGKISLLSEDNTCYHSAMIYFQEKVQVQKKPCKPTIC